VPGKTRIFYRAEPEAVVVEKDGKEVAAYRNADELVEVHIKGLLAKNKQDSKRVRDLLRKYRPDDFVKS
jgi:HEPN domain-containing protein